jgi:hypothetical protein
LFLKIFGDENKSFRATKPQLIFVPANNRQAEKYLPKANTLAYLVRALMTKKKNYTFNI